MFSSLLLGGSNRPFAEHVGDALRSELPAYDVVTDLDTIPKKLRGLHPDNPVNLPRQQGVQIELPPRVRGSSPLWWDWEGPGLTPHTNSLIDGLVTAAYDVGSVMVDPGVGILSAAGSRERDAHIAARAIAEYDRAVRAH